MNWVVKLLLLAVVISLVWLRCAEAARLADR